MKGIFTCVGLLGSLAIFVKFVVVGDWLGLLLSGLLLLLLLFLFVDGVASNPEPPKAG